VYTGDRPPSYVTELLGLAPTSIAVMGERASSFSDRIYPINGWFMRSKEFVNSKDLWDHLDWIFERIAPCEPELRSAQEQGCEIKIWCYWLSLEGQGGPTLSPKQLRNLSRFELEVYFDIYFVGGPGDEGSTDLTD
jgi:hypothetical protein